MTRRFSSSLIGAAIAAVALSSCGTLDTSAAAVVNGLTLTHDQLVVVAQSPLAGGPILGPAVEGDATRRIITVWVRNAALEGSGIIDGVDLEAVRAEIAAALGPQFEESDPFAQDLLIRNQAVIEAIEQGLADEEAAIELVTSAEVEIDARYGRWSPDDLAVVPFGG